MTDALSTLLTEAIGDAEDAATPGAHLGSREIPNLLAHLPYADANMVRAALRAGSISVLEAPLRSRPEVQEIFTRHTQLARCATCGAPREHAEFDGRFFFDACAPCGRIARRESWRAWRQQVHATWWERAADACGQLHWPREVNINPLLSALLDSSETRTQWGAYLVGPAGTGKTQQAVELIRTYLRARLARLTPSDMERWSGQTPVLPAFRFISESALLRSMRPGGDGRMEQYTQTPLLVLDDLGESKATDWAYETVKSLIDERYRRRLTTVFTSNRTLPALRSAGLYDERITSRIFEMCGGLDAHKRGELAVIELTTSWRLPRDEAHATQEVMW